MKTKKKSEPMETRRQVAERLGIKLARLETTLSVMKFEPTERRIEKGKAVHYYDKKTAAKIQKLFQPEGDPSNA